jgi:hypothetical protein
MKMIPYACVGLAAVALFVGQSAVAQFGSFSMPGAKKSTPAPAAAAIDPDTFLATAKDAEGLMTKSLDEMSDALLAKEEAAKIAALKKQANETTDAHEKEALTQQIAKTEAASLSQQNFDEAGAAQIKEMDSEKRKKLAGSSFNFLLAVLRDQQLVGQSTGVINGLAANPANFGKLGAVKDAASSVSSQLGMSGSLAAKMPKLFAAVGVKDMPKVTDKAVSKAD